VLLVGQDDEKVASFAGLSPSVWKWLRADRDSGGIGRQTECVFAGVIGAGEHDGAEGSAHVFDRAGHGAAVELDAVGRELPFLSEVRHAEA
jgi:hypothetical protein